MMTLPNDTCIGNETRRHEDTKIRRGKLLFFEPLSLRAFVITYPKDAYLIGWGPIVLILLVLTACGGSASAEPSPPTIHYGEDICEACGMIITDARFAAAYVTEDGDGHTFDEIAGMVNTYLEMQDDVAAFFVHDYEDQSWLRAETATYVYSSDMVTPMAFGVVAFASPEKAAALAGEVHGEVMDFEAMMAHFRMQATMMSPDAPADAMENHSHPAQSE